MSASPHSVRYRRFHRPEGTHGLLLYADVPTLVLAIPLEGSPVAFRLAGSEAEGDDLIRDLVLREDVREGVMALLEAAAAGRAHERGD